MNPRVTIGEYLTLLNVRIDQRQALWLARQFDAAVILGLRIDQARRLFKGGCFSMAHQILMEAL